MNPKLRSFLLLLQQAGHIPDCDNIDELPQADLDAAWELLEAIQALGPEG